MLVWTPVPGASGYRLYRKIGEGAFAEIYQGAANSFMDSSVPVSEDLVYKVVATLDGKEGKPSPERVLKGLKPLEPPTPVGALSTADSITLRWTFPPNAVYSKVYRSVTPKGPFLFHQSVQGDTYIDRKVRKGKKYYYRMTVVDFQGRESRMSESIGAEARVAGLEPKAAEMVIRKVVPMGEFSGERVYELNQPGGIGFNKEGELYVLDRRSIQFFDADGVFRRRIDLEKEWGLAGGLAVDGVGNFLLPFYAGEVVRKIDGEGNYLREVRYPRLEEKTINNPNDIAVDGEGNLWILDGVRSQVVRIDRTFRSFRVIGRPWGIPPKPEEKDPEPAFPAPKRIYYNAVDRRIYLVLGISAEIRVIDPGTFRVVAEMGGLGEGLDRFHGIAGLAFRKNGNLLVLDPYRRIIKEFTKDFRYVATYADIVHDDEIRLSSRLVNDFVFREESGRFYVTSTLGNRVYMFDLAED
jgi:sugar lactone lactonase YvrE